MSDESRLDALYARVPGMKCKGFCAESCGPIGASRAEVRRIEAVGGRRLTVLVPDLVCSMLKDGRCTVYDARPLICRLCGLSQRWQICILSGISRS